MKPHRLSHRSPAPRILGIAGLCLCVGLAACESDATAVTSPDQRAAASPVQNAEYGKLGYRLDWRGFPTLSPGATIARMEPLGDVVVTQDTAGLVCVLEARSGERRWSDPVANPLTRFVGLNRDGKRLIVSSESEVFTFDLDTGALLTKARLDQVVNTRPVQVAEILVYGCNSGQVLGQLTLNGFRQWGSFAAGSINVDPVPVGDTGVVALASSQGDVVFLDGITGSLRGRGRMFSGPGAPIAASDTTVFVASRDHSLYAFTAESLAPLWRIRTEEPLRHAPVYHEGRVYCDMGADGMCAFDASTGKQLWSNKSVHGTFINLRDGRLIAWDGATAAMVDPIRGGLVDAVELKDIADVRADRFVDGQLYLASKAGVVSRLTPRR